MKWRGTVDRWRGQPPLISDVRQEEMKRAIIAAGILVLSLVILHACLPDGIHGTASALVHGHSTRYAPGYSYSGFMRVHSGMTSQEVVNVLGEPLHRFSVTDATPGADLTVTGWQYSLNRDPTNSYCRMRLVLFEKGRVTEKSSLFCPPFNKRKQH